MIFPFLQGLKGFDHAPFTWLVILLNTILYTFFFPNQFISHQKIEAHLNNPVMQETMAQVYLDELKHKSRLTEIQQKLLARGETGESVLPQALQMAMQDADFIRSAESLAPRGDVVAFSHWQKWMIQFQEDNAQRPMTQFGVSAVEHSSLNMVTYQYIHAGAMHLIMNMLVLIIFGSVLEPVLGSLVFLLVYTVSGVVGAFAFVQWSGLGQAPLVGASASISGLMAFYAIIEHRPRVAFAYFLGPFQGFYGLIYLPTWLIFPVCFLADLTSLIQTSGVTLGGVAYAAHLGGAIMGLILAVSLKPLLLFGRRKTSS